jgi:hypothetical protein
VKRAWAILAMVLVALAIAALFVLWKTESEPAWELSPPHPFGAALLARASGGDRLLFLVNRQEDERHRSRSVGPGPRQVYELRAYATDTLRPVWTTRLLSEDGGHPATSDMKLLGLDGDRVWVFVREPVLVALANGAIVPGATSYVAPPAPVPEQPKSWDEYDALQARQALAAGSIETKFRIAGGTFGDGWFGVLSTDEATVFASRGTTPVLHDGDFGRSLFAAQRGDDGRFVDPQRLGDSDFLAGGLLREAGSVEPLRATDPDGAFVLYRELTVDTAAWHVARVDLAGESRWDVALPVAEVEQLWQTADAVLLVGPRNTAGGGARHRLLVAMDVRDGALRATDLESDAPPTP